ncbi:HAMP domain-containing sensor histidine kinase [Paenibacillus koleovorans]|uniref:HAMP domain-containing sensor histidine kinase n=1 Tax=Paenibacillus koleovorans TaxID=121608 RepID=UPI000FD726E0|nr:HAMP domain-containing histidine kinase [Paenibacillus koleovorans]
MKFTRWARFFSRIPIKFKLTLWSTVLIMVLLLSNYGLQYLVMEKWIIHREKSSVQRNMNEVLNHVLEQETNFKSEQLKDIKQFLSKVNREDQMIRIVDDDDSPIVTVSNDVAEHLTPPRSVSVQQISVYRMEAGPVLVMRSPFTIFEFNGTVEIVKSMAVYEQLIDTLLEVMQVFAVVAVLLSLLVGWLIVRKMLKPLQAMSQTIRDVNRNGLQERMIPAHNGDEISTLMVQFNEMMDKVEESFWQRSRFVEDASHELRTPIAIIEGHLTLLSRWGKNDPNVLDESLRASLDEFSRLKGLVSELLTLSRAEKDMTPLERPLANPVGTIGAILERFMTLHPDFEIELELENLEGYALLVSPDHLEQIMLILLDNAVKYSKAANTIHVRAGLDVPYATLMIEDQGIGIPAQDLPYVTERFYRVDRARRRTQGGNGLGLAIAKRLVERYQGKLVIRSEENVGTAVTLYIPLTPDGASKKEESA